MQPIPAVPVKPTQQEQGENVVHHQQQYAPVMGTVAPGYVRPNPLYQAPTHPISFWSTSLCSCMDDVDSCVESTFCNRCQLSRQYNQITYGTNVIEPWTFMGSLAIDVFLGAPLTQWAFSWYLRNRVRARYQIAGDDLNDCIVTFFATMCSTAQIYREMSLRGEWSSGCCITKPFTLVAPPPVPTMDDNTVSDEHMEQVQQ
jgi:Cys-rich protein (TIGR01571 family)